MSMTHISDFVTFWSAFRAAWADVAVGLGPVDEAVDADPRRAVLLPLPCPIATFPIRIATLATAQPTAPGELL